MSPVIFLWTLLQGFFCYQITYIATPRDAFTYVYQSPTHNVFTVKSLSDTIYLSVLGAAYLDDNGYWIIGQGGTNFADWSYNLSTVQRVRNYERNDCNNEAGIPTSGETKYVSAATPYPTLMCRYDGGLPGGGSPSDTFFVCSLGRTWYVAPFRVYSNGTTYDFNSGKWTFKCRDRSYSNLTGNFPLYVQVSKLGNADSCSYSSDATCKSCSWPYTGQRDTSYCGCIVDRSKYQSEEDLKRFAYLYCNSISGSTQYYLDYSRSNFNISLGSIRAACSSPASGSTVYVPAGTCPVGSHLDTVSLPDSAYQAADGTVPPSDGISSGSGFDSAAQNRLDSILGNIQRGDVGTHDRLDTIIDLLRNQPGGSGGYDSSLAPKLDSLRAFLDTTGDGAYDSIQSRLGYVIDSISNDTFDIKPTIDSLMGVINTHSSRGDTSGYDGATLDSMLNFCLTMPIQDSTYCLRDTPAWPYIGPLFRWIRRMILVFWGFVCAGIFLGIAHGGNDD